MLLYKLNKANKRSKEKFMKSIINLESNYYFRVESNGNDLSMDVLDIREISLGKILKRETILLKIDFNNINIKEYKKILKKLLNIKKITSRIKIKIGVQQDSKILLGYIVNYKESNKQQNDFILAINAICYKTRYERYNYIYDTVCDYLDSYFYGKNLCDFKNNQCGEKRNTNSFMGCCHHHKNKILGPLAIKSNFVICEHLKEDYTCGAKCISCKLFTCDYLKRKGVKFRIKDILLLDIYFNPIQKYFIKHMVYTQKEKIIKRLMML